jgi:alpha-N-acetylglucosamine transferase
MLDKFRILGMTEYRRVLFLDGDVVPLVNLDYLFELSDPAHTTTPTILMENLVVAGLRTHEWWILYAHTGAPSKSIPSFRLEKSILESISKEFK